MENVLHFASHASPFGQPVARMPACVVLAKAMVDQVSTGFLGLDDELRVVLYNQAAARILEIGPCDIAEAMPLDILLNTSSGLDGVARAAMTLAITAASDAAAETRRHRIDLPDRRVLKLHVGRQQDGSRLAVFNVEDLATPPAERIDPLTGLSDQRWFRERVDLMLADPARADQVAILMIDLDRFKAVNDSYGHPVGDGLLRLVAGRLRSAIRVNDVASRLGGDEFALALPAPAAAEAMGSRLVDLLSRPYLVQEHLATIGASIGIAFGCRDGTSANELIGAADLALYQAKRNGRGCVRVYDHDLRLRARQRTDMEIDLRRALPLRQFELHFQPQTELAAGKLVGFEALVRWRHPRLGLVPPDQFIPMAEELGLIVPLGEWVLRTACSEAAAWPGHLTVAVNVSPRQLVDGSRLLKAAAAALAQSGLPSARLELEITESALMEQGVLEVLQGLHGLGVKISMDDFGTGYSSLSQLRSFPFDKLKIDRSFIQGLGTSAEAAAVVRAIAALGASMSITTTAEGVETPEQEAIIRADGCTTMQGYLVSRPVPLSDVAALIDRLQSKSLNPSEKAHAF